MRGWRSEHACECGNGRRCEGAFLRKRSKPAGSRQAQLGSMLCARCRGARSGRAMGPAGMPRSGGLPGGVRNDGEACEAADLDEVEPGAGAGGRVAVAKLLAELHPQPAEDVAALVAIGDGSRAPPGVAGRDLDDGPVAGRGQHRVDRDPVRLALHPQHPAHDVDALRVPAGVDAETRRST